MLHVTVQLDFRNNYVNHLEQFMQNPDIIRIKSKRLIIENTKKSTGLKNLKKGKLVRSTKEPI